MKSTEFLRGGGGRTWTCLAVDPGSLFVIELAAGPNSCPNTRQAYFRPTPPPPPPTPRAIAIQIFISSKVGLLQEIFIRRIKRFQSTSGKKLLCLTKDLLVVPQCYGSGLIKSGSGSSILVKYRSGTGSRVLMTKNWQKFIAGKKIFFYLQEKPSALKKEHAALQCMKFFTTFYLFLWVIFALLHPNPIRIRNTACDSVFSLLIVPYEYFDYY